MRLRDKVAIITGAGGGIGRATAQRFAAEGAKVVVADVDERAGRESVEQIDGVATFLRIDVSRWDDGARLARETLDRFGRIDVLFNNAGIYRTGATTVVDTDEVDWDATIAVNLKGAFVCSRHVLPVMMAQRRGVIVNTASRAGIAARPRMAAYCAAKAGVVALTRQLAVDYAAYNIRVNCICPAALEHPMGEASNTTRITDQTQQAKLLQDIPLGRLCTVADVANAALYLASDAAGYVTGTALYLDGGSLSL